MRPSPQPTQTTLESPYYLNTITPDKSKTTIISNMIPLMFINNTLLFWHKEAKEPSVKISTFSGKRNLFSLSLSCYKLSLSNLLAMLQSKLNWSSSKQSQRFRPNVTLKRLGLYSPGIRLFPAGYGRAALVHTFNGIQRGLCATRVLSASTLSSSKKLLVKNKILATTRKVYRKLPQVFYAYISAIDKP